MGRGTFLLLVTALVIVHRVHGDLLERVGVCLNADYNEGDGNETYAEGTRICIIYEYTTKIGETKENTDRDRDEFVALFDFCTLSESEKEDMKKKLVDAVRDLDKFKNGEIDEDTFMTHLIDSIFDVLEKVLQECLLHIGKKAANSNKKVVDEDLNSI